MKSTRFLNAINQKGTLFASALAIAAALSNAPGLHAASFLEGIPITISAHLNNDVPESAVVTPNFQPGQDEILSPSFSWMDGDRFDIIYDVDRERFRFFITPDHPFTASDVLYISYELPEGFAFGASALTRAYNNGPDSVKGFVEGRVLRFELRVLDSITHHDGYTGVGAEIEFTTFVQSRAFNEVPQIVCAPSVITCAPEEGAYVTKQVIVIDSNRENLTVILKSGDQEIDRQVVAGPANNKMVTFKPVFFPLGSHPLTISVADSFTETSSESSVTVQTDNSAPEFTSVPEDIVVSATTLAGAVVDFEDALAVDTCSESTIGYSQDSGTLFPIGTTTVVCTATDAAGHQSTETFNVTVGLPWSGVRQPINPDGSSVFRAGSTVPVKFQLTGVAAGISGLHATLSFAKISNLSVGDVNEAISTSNATTGNLFRFDGGDYIFNWSTRGLTAGTYQLFINLGDGIDHTVIVGLR